MRGEAIITFDEPFKISENGAFTETNSVTLRAPGLGKRHVHSTMQAYVMEAISEMQRKRPDLMKKAEVAIDEDDDAPTAPAKEADPEQEALGIWQMMQMGLGPDRFPTLDRYVRAELTGSPKLASVGNNGMPLMEGAWEAIAETNGIEAIDRICGTFVGFFMGSPKSTKKSGAATSLSSSSPPKAAFPSSTRTNSRSPR